MSEIFSDPALRAVSKELLKATLQLGNFAENAKFNPYRDLPKVVAAAPEVQASWDTDTGKPIYSLEELNATKRYNYKHRLTALTTGYVAGIFMEILRSVGYPAFIKCWRNYVEDMIDSLVPGNPYAVATILKELAINFDTGIMPDQTVLLSKKCITMWEYDFNTSDVNYCSPMPMYEVSSDRAAYTELKKLAQVSRTQLYRLMNMEAYWRARDAHKALCWCIVTGVHPTRLLNYFGYWASHKESQPEHFQLVNPNTQEYEVAVRDKGEIVGYEPAPIIVSAGFLHTLGKLINQVNWSDPKKYAPGEYFVNFMLKVDMHDFASMNTLLWQPVPLSQDSIDYYLSMGLTDKNAITIRELTQKAPKAPKSKVIDEMKLTATGNPLFDMAMVEDGKLDVKDIETDE